MRNVPETFRGFPSHDQLVIPCSRSRRVWSCKTHAVLCTCMHNMPRLWRWMKIVLRQGFLRLLWNITPLSSVNISRAFRSIFIRYSTNFRVMSSPRGFSLISFSPFYSLNQYRTIIDDFLLHYQLLHSCEILFYLLLSLRVTSLGIFTSLFHHRFEHTFAHIHHAENVWSCVEMLINI